MSYEALAILCLVAGLVLLIAEFFLPTGGMIGIVCVVSFVISVWAAKKAWYGVQPGMWYAYLLSLFVLIPGSFYGIFRVIRDTDYGKNVFLEGPQIADVTAFDDEQKQLDDLIGRVGTTETDLLPSGVCRIEGDRIDCVTDGPKIPAGSRVTVIGRRGFQPLVREATADEQIDAFRRGEDPSGEAASEANAETPAEPVASEDESFIEDPFA